jgi:hypothetical protein
MRKDETRVRAGIGIELKPISTAPALYLFWVYHVGATSEFQIILGEAQIKEYASRIEPNDVWVGASGLGALKLIGENEFLGVSKYALEVFYNGTHEVVCITSKELTEITYPTYNEN